MCLESVFWIGGWKCMSLLSDILHCWQRDSHITSLSLLKNHISKWFSDWKNAHVHPKHKLEMHTPSLYRTWDFSVLHSYKQALQSLNVNFITWCCRFRVLVKYMHFLLSRTKKNSYVMWVSYLWQCLERGFIILQLIVVEAHWTLARMKLNYFLMMSPLQSPFLSDIVIFPYLQVYWFLWSHCGGGRLWANGGF